MEPPSPSLIASLRDLGLADSRDLRRASRHCRRLSRDLPAFDSVWIDSLVRLRRLTLFQARELEDGRGRRLRIGDCLLRDRLGAGNACATYVARRNRALVCLKEIAVGPERQTSIVDRFQELIATGRGLRSQHLAVPHEIADDEGRIVLVSRYVPDQDARSVLIRQGRFMPADVVDIALQLLEGLREAHRLGIVHGDIHAGNLRVSRRYGAVCVDAGVRTIVDPVVSIHDMRPPSWYEGTAPERIGTSAVASPASDLYGLGCLLWHLLAGRPPFLAGDSLATLAAHRTRPLPPVTDFAPETPPALAELIENATQLDPDARPTDILELQRRLRSTQIAVGIGRWRRPRVAPGRGFPWTTAAAALLTLGVACAGLAERDAVATLLSMRAGSDEVIHRAAGHEADDGMKQRLTPLPAPDEHGVISLDHAGQYTVGDIDVHGPLVIRGRFDRPATIVVTDRPMHIRADELTLENVHVTGQSTPAFTVGTVALLLVETQNLTIRSCRFTASIKPAAERSTSPAGVAWRLIDGRDPTAGRLLIKDSVVRGVRELLFLASPPRQVQLSNILAVGVRSIVAMQKTGAMPAEFAIERTTVRDAVAVLRLGDAVGRGGVQVTARDSILDLATNGPLFAGPAAADRAKLHWDGAGVVTSGEVCAFASIGVANATGADSASLAEVTGVSQATVEFAGPVDGSDAASIATVRGVPRQAGQLLGVDLSTLPSKPQVSDGPR